MLIVHCQCFPVAMQVELVEPLIASSCTLVHFAIWQVQTLEA